MATKSKSNEQEREAAKVEAGGARNTSVEAATVNDARNEEMKNGPVNSVESPGTAINDFASLEQQTQDDMPEPTGEPPIPLAPGTHDDRAFSVDEVVPASPRMIAPPAPVRNVIPNNVRTVEDADLNSVGFKALVPSAKLNVESLILRPGDRVVGAVDVYPCDDVRDEARITLLPGAAVPDEARAFFPAHYMSDVQRRALAGTAPKVGSRR